MVSLQSLKLLLRYNKAAKLWIMRHTKNNDFLATSRASESSLLYRRFCSRRRAWIRVSPRRRSARVALGHDTDDRRSGAPALQGRNFNESESKEDLFHSSCARSKRGLLTCGSGAAFTRTALLMSQHCVSALFRDAISSSSSGDARRVR